MSTRVIFYNGKFEKVKVLESLEHVSHVELSDGKVISVENSHIFKKKRDAIENTIFSLRMKVYVLAPQENKITPEIVEGRIVLKLGSPFKHKYVLKTDVGYLHDMSYFFTGNPGRRLESISSHDFFLSEEEAWDTYNTFLTSQVTKWKKLGKKIKTGE